MIPGTTPTITIEVEDFDFSLIDFAEVTFKQNNYHKVVKSGDELLIDEMDGIISVTLTQEETFKFNEGSPVGIQIRIKLLDGSVTSSEVIWEEVGMNLNAKVI